ncbi:MAG: type II toxin-antitoxin system RatA family toxin [Caulobacterales bacterium]|nr:type II toxin-antitoxin system RatA family toxin [Caulobacterales bacterium]
MAVHRVTRILPYRPEELFALVGGVREYPEFVPWISSIRVWNEREIAPGVMALDAEAQVGFAMVRERFTTAVKRDSQARRINVELIRGPFKHLRNEWRFSPHEAGTRVEFYIDFEFRSKMLDRILQANFDRAAHRLISCFEQRAAMLYGRPTA